MPDVAIILDAELYRRLQAWAHAQDKPLPDLARDILAAAERAYAQFDPSITGATRDIRRHRDGGCGLCDALEPLFEETRRVG